MTAAFIQGPSLAQTEIRIHKVHGFVTDARMIRVKDAQIEFMKGEKQITEQTATDGAFSLTIPSGIYTLRVTAKGFCQSSQGVAVMETDSDKIFDVALLDCSDCPDMSIDFVEPRVEPDAAPPTTVDPSTLVFKYRQEKLDNERSDQLRPSVLFGRRSDLGEFIEYTGLDCPGKDKLPTLIYSGGALRANKLLFTKKSHKVRGEGQVTIVDTQGIRYGSIVEVDLVSESPQAAILRTKGN